MRGTFQHCYHESNTGYRWCYYSMYTASFSKRENIFWTGVIRDCFFSITMHTASCPTTTAAGHIRIKMNLTDKFSTVERSESKCTVESDCSPFIYVRQEYPVCFTCSVFMHACVHARVFMCAHVLWICMHGGVNVCVEASGTQSFLCLVKALPPCCSPWKQWAQLHVSGFLIRGGEDDNGRRQIKRIPFHCSWLWMWRWKEKDQKFSIQFSTLIKGAWGENEGGTIKFRDRTKGIRKLSKKKKRERERGEQVEARMRRQLKGRTQPPLIHRQDVAHILTTPHPGFESYSTIWQAGLMEYTGPLINLQIMLTVHSQVTFNVTPPW